MSINEPEEAMKPSVTPPRSRLDLSSRPQSKLRSSRTFEALARWLIALQPRSSLTRLSTTNSLAESFSYLTQLPIDLSMQFVLDAWMQPASRERLRADKELLLASEIPSVRLRQILTRLLRYVRKNDADGLRRTELFRGFVCELPLVDSGINTQTATAFCEMERSLTCASGQKSEVRAGSAFFQGEALRASLPLTLRLQ